MNVFDDLAPRRDWTPPDLNEVAAAIRASRQIELDAETKSLKWWTGPTSVGWAVGTDAGAWYLPTRHQHPDGGNLDADQVATMLRAELPGKLVANHSTRYDCHVAREDGVDLDALGCRLTDVAHHAALLDDHRKQFNLDVLGQSFVGQGKVSGLDKRRMASYHPSDVAPYAVQDVRLVREICAQTRPRLEAEGLLRVLDVEDALIPVVCEMERNACPIDVDKLDRWLKETEQACDELDERVARAMGRYVRRFNPDSSDDWAALFRARKLDLPAAKTATGRTSFADDVLAAVDDEIVRDARRLSQIADLRSRYLVKYRQTVGADGRLRYALHQLRIDEGGTVSGRFSSSAVRVGDRELVGDNVQYVLALDKQRAKYGPRWTIRDLFMPAAGLFLSADAKQIEYRLFAHYANNPEVVAAYARDPHTSFHEFVHALIRPRRPSMSYKHVKNLNFASIYGAGLPKLAAMMGFVSLHDAERLRRARESRGGRYDQFPELREAIELASIYDRVIPEAKPLLRRAAQVAEERGYVRTLLGRRARFPGGHRAHKALNSIVQGGAADLMKLKLVELHRERRHTGLTLRATVHDEVIGDAPDAEAAARVGEVLDRQSVPLRVPILWDVAAGPTWATCN